MPNLSKLRYASPRSSTLADDLRGAAHGYLQASGDHRYADAGLIAKGLFLAICAVLFYAAMVTAASPVVFVLAYLGFPFFAMLLAMNVLHDGAHRAHVVKLLLVLRTGRQGERQQREDEGGQRPAQSGEVGHVSYSF